LGDLLHEYGKLVTQVENELQTEKIKQQQDLEERLKKRREAKKAEALKRRQKLEEEESLSIS
jgi:hypothetical protein